MTVTEPQSVEVMSAKLAYGRVHGRCLATVIAPEVQKSTCPESQFFERCHRQIDGLAASDRDWRGRGPRRRAGRSHRGLELLVERGELSDT